MDLQYSRWARLRAIRQSIPLHSCLNLTELTFLPCCSWSAMRSSRFTLLDNHNTTPAACTYFIGFQVVFQWLRSFRSQVNVKNGGADKPSASDLTTFPGMYNGFNWPDIWTDSLDGFIVAGPKIVSFADGGSSDPAPSPSSGVPSSSVPPSSVPSDSYGPSPTVSRPYSTSVPANPTSTSVCRATKKRSNKRSIPGRHIHRRRSVH